MTATEMRDAALAAQQTRLATQLDDVLAAIASQAQNGAMRFPFGSLAQATVEALRAQGFSVTDQGNDVWLVDWSSPGNP